MDRTFLHIGRHGRTIINRVARHVKHTSQNGLPYGGLDFSKGICYLHATAKTIGGAHGNSTDNTLAEMALHLEGNTLHLESRIHLGHMVLKGDVYDDTDDSDDFSLREGLGTHMERKIRDYCASAALAISEICWVITC